MSAEPEAPPPARRRIKQMEVMVAEAIPETADTTTLVFFTGNDRLDYKAGHFLTIDPHQFEGLERFIAFLEDLKGKPEPPRAYSMVVSYARTGSSSARRAFAVDSASSSTSRGTA